MEIGALVPEKRIFCTDLIIYGRLWPCDPDAANKGYRSPYPMRIHGNLALIGQAVLEIFENVDDGRTDAGA